MDRKTGRRDAARAKVVDAESLPASDLRCVGVKDVIGSSSTANSSEVVAVGGLNALVLRRRWIHHRQPEFLLRTRRGSGGHNEGGGSVARPPPLMANDVVPFQRSHCELSREKIPSLQLPGGLAATGASGSGSFSGLCGDKRFFVSSGVFRQ